MIALDMPDYKAAIAAALHLSKVAVCLAGINQLWH